MRHEEFLKAEEIFAVYSDIRGYFFRVVVLVLEPADWHINHLPVHFHPDLLNWLFGQSAEEELREGVCDGADDCQSKAKDIVDSNQSSVFFWLNAIQVVYLCCNYFGKEDSDWGENETISKAEEDAEEEECFLFEEIGAEPGKSCVWIRIFYCICDLELYYYILCDFSAFYIGFSA